MPGCRPNDSSRPCQAIMVRVLLEMRGNHSRDPTRHQATTAFDQVRCKDQACHSRNLAQWKAIALSDVI